MNRYGAKLLFQFRVASTTANSNRLCEERIIQLQANSAEEAMSIAKRKGRAAEFKYRNTDGNWVHFEFVGVMDLLKLGAECNEDEVWYDIRRRLTPMERKAKIIPTAAKLLSRISVQ